jgi:hypothetical protein
VFGGGIDPIVERYDGVVIFSRSGGGACMEGKKESWSAGADIYTGRVVAKFAGVARARLCAVVVVPRV